MAVFDTNNPTYGLVRRLEPTDWAHADVLNATLSQIVANTAALYCARWRINNITIQPANWKQGTYVISDERIKTNSIADVYFASESVETAQGSGITGSTKDGKIVFVCESAPDDEIVIDCIEIRNEVVANAGEI